MLLYYKPSWRICDNLINISTCNCLNMLIWCVVKKNDGTQPIRKKWQSHACIPAIVVRIVAPEAFAFTLQSRMGLTWDSASVDTSGIRTHTIVPVWLRGNSMWPFITTFIFAEFLRKFITFLAVFGYFCWWGLRIWWAQWGWLGWPAMSQKVSLRLNVKLPSAGLNGQLQRADESVIDNVLEKASPPPSTPDSRQISPTSSRRSHSARSTKQVSPAVRRREICIKVNNDCFVLSASTCLYVEYISVFLKCKLSSCRCLLLLLMLWLFLLYWNVSCAESHFIIQTIPTKIPTGGNPSSDRHRHRGIK